MKSLYYTLCDEIADKIRLSFTSSNSSFSECVRKHSFYQISHNTHLNSKDVNPDCPHYITGEKCFYEEHTVQLSGGEHTFADSQFISCQHSGYGGAIDQIDGDLTIKRCVFDTCSCTSRGGAVSFRSSGTCLQEDNLYQFCSGELSGAFDSFDTTLRPVHDHKRCKYVSNSAVNFGHSSIEYSPKTLIDSNIYIHGRSTKLTDAGTVVNYNEQGPILYRNCVFFDGQSPNSGGLTLLSYGVYSAASLSVKFCFFLNNYGTDGTAYEIYFNARTCDNAREDLIIHSFTATPNSRVYIENNAQPIQNWLPQGRVSFPFDWSTPS